MPFTNRLYHHTAPTGSASAPRARRTRKRQVADETPHLPAREYNREPAADDLTKYMYQGDFKLDESYAEAANSPYFVVPRAFDQTLGRFLPRDP